jgi:transposase
VLNRIQQLLEGATIKLAAVVSDVQGVTAQHILRALVDGETDPALLAQLACGKLQKKQAELERAVEGHFQAHQRFMLTRLLRALDFFDAELTTLGARLEAVLAHLPAFAGVVEQRDTIPGVNPTVARVSGAEIGVDMARFPSDRQRAAWAGVAPGTTETGGKQRASASRQGNRHLQRALVQAAWAAARTQDCYVRAVYYRIASRRGARRAAVAVGRTILQIAYHLIRKQTSYHEVGGDYFDRVDRERTRARWVRRLQTLGFEVSVTDGTPPGAAPTLAGA